MTPTNPISNDACDILAAQLKQTLPRLKLDFNVLEEQKSFLAKIPERVIARGKFAYPGDFRFLDGKKVTQTLYPPLKDTPERRLISLANLYFTFNEKDDEIFEYCAKIPGIDIIDRSGCNAPGQYCDWFVFKDEPWFNPRNSPILFLPLALKFLEDRGYHRTKAPEMGGIVVYFHSQDAREEIAGKPAHYGKIVGFDVYGEPIIESKFVHMFVYRHKQELVPSSFGNEVVYLRKEKTVETKS